ncbi:hypothetical protein MMC09_001718 [Bachmanniomyces sp. S44760]|nr:hypothetical protein [Bachmanniomyces sp. S44760]
MDQHNPKLYKTLSTLRRRIKAGREEPDPDTSGLIFLDTQGNKIPTPDPATFAKSRRKRKRSDKSKRPPAPVCPPIIWSRRKQVRRQKETKKPLQVDDGNPYKQRQIERQPTLQETGVLFSMFDKKPPQEHPENSATESTKAEKKKVVLHHPLVKNLYIF